MDLMMLMQQATAEVTAPPAVLEAATRGGRRRLRRRRVRIAGGTAVAAVALAGGALVVAPHTRERAAVPAGARWDGHTHGDLAGDASYVEDVLAAWGNHVARSGTHPLGRAHVLWAGTTPAGPAAVVEQPARLPRQTFATVLLPSEPQPPTKDLQLLGFLAPGDDGPRVVGESYPTYGDLDVRGWYVDRDRTVLAAYTGGREVDVARGITYLDDGRSVHRWAPLPDDDGVGWVVLPHQSDGAVVRVQLSRPPHGDRDQLNIVGGPGLDTITHDPDTRLPWWDGEGAKPLLLPVGKAQREFGPKGPAAAGRLADLLDAALWPREVSTFSSGFSPWFVYGTLDDGRAFAVGERPIDGDASQQYLVVRAANKTLTVRHLGASDRTAVLPVRAAVPGGWVVAAKGAALRWRAGTGAWSAPLTDGGLLPAAATDVEVTRPGRPPAVVPLR